MKKHWNKILVVLFVVGLTIALTSCGEADGAEQKVAEEKNSNEQLNNVRVQKVEEQQFNDFITIVGTVKAVDEANLSVEEGGVIRRFKYDKGSFVKRGDTLVILENKIAKANLDAAKAQYDMADMSYQKQMKIYKDNVNSEFQMQQSKYERDAAKANYELMKARYDKTFILAPFAGVIDAKYFETGELAPPMSQVVRVINPNSIKIEAGIPERYINAIKNGGSVKVRIRELTEEDIPGRITYVGTSVSNVNRTFPIDVIVSKYGNKIKPNISAEILVFMDKLENVIVVPEEVITKTDLGDVVYVAEAGKAEMKEVSVITRYDNKAAIKGLKSGDNLIVVGYQNLVSGEKVNVVN